MFKLFCFIALLSGITFIAGQGTLPFAPIANPAPDAWIPSQRAPAAGLPNVQTNPNIPIMNYPQSMYNIPTGIPNVMNPQASSNIPYSNYGQQPIQNYPYSNHAQQPIQNYPYVPEDTRFPNSANSFVQTRPTTASEFYTQQFRAPGGPSFPSLSPFSGIARSTPQLSSLPGISDLAANTMASNVAPTLVRGASQLAQIPDSIISQVQAQTAQSAAAAGMTTEQAQAIVQEAMQRGANILTPPRPKPSSCGSTDFECQFYSACFSCYANRNQPQCMHCLNLDNCAGDLSCQTQRACAVCTRLPKSDRPAACDILKC